MPRLSEGRRRSASYRCPCASASDCLIVDPPPVPTVPVEAVTGVSVTSEVEADQRRLAGYLVKFQIQGMLKLTVRVLDILRTMEELSTLTSQIRRKFPFSIPGILVFPETFTVDSLNAWINVSMTTDTLRTLQLFEDFATINFKDCFEVKWSKDMTTLPTVSKMRLLTFWPVLPKCQSREDRRRHVLERLPKRFICISCRTLLTSCTPSVVTGLPTDCYVDKIRLEPASSSEGLCSSFHGQESSSVSFEGSFGSEH